jgi:DNA-binding SARP family transcriptional activator
MAYRLLTLGRPTLLCEDGSAAKIALGKPLAILAFLSLERGRVGRDDLANMFWATKSQRAARTSVRQALSFLRTHLAEGLINADDAPEILNHHLLAADAREFSDALAEMRVKDAIALWRGPFMDRVVFSDAPDWNRWVDEQQSDLEQEYCLALRRAAHQELTAARATTALGYARLAVALKPLDPALHIIRFEASLALRNADELTAALMEARRSFRELPGVLDLERWEREECALRATAERPVVASGPRIEFVGRSEQLADLRAFWLNARRGSMRAAFLSGPTGIGKTRLAEETAELASRDGATVISIKCAEGERSIKWGLAASLAARLLRVRGASGMSPVSDTVLRSLNPSMAAAPGRQNGSASQNGPGPSHSSNGSEAHALNGVSVALADAFIDLISCVGNDKAPLFVHIDDLQWCDGPSRALLARVLRNVRAAACMFVVTFRSEDATPALLALLRALARERAAAVTELPPLSAGEVSELLGLTLELDGSEGIAAFVKRVHTITAGNPLFVTELLRALHDEGAIHNGQGRWGVDEARIQGNLPWPESLQAVVDRRLEQLSPAASVLVGHFARLRNAASLDELRERTDMSESAFTRGTRELLSREVLRWLEGDRLEFTHDQLRLGALRRFPVAQSSALPAIAARRRAPIVAAAAAITALALGLSWQALSSNEPDNSGGGTLFVGIGDSIYTAMPGDEEEDPWSIEPFAGPYLKAPERKGPFRGAGAEPAWFRDVPAATGPDIAHVTATGEEKIVISGPKDENAIDLSPDGGWLLFSRDDPSTPEYDQGIWLADTLGQSSRLLYQSESAPTHGTWSPDGRRILIIDKSVDSVFVIRPDGHRMTAFPMKQVESAAWCGTSEWFVALQDPRRTPAVVLVDVRSGATRKITNNVVADRLLCSPDGTRIAFSGLHDHRVVTTITEIENGRTTHVQENWPPGFVKPLAWLPKRPTPMPRRIRLSPPTRSLVIGERLTLEAKVLFSDGTVRAEPLGWRSSANGVASVSANGVVSANAPGVTRIHADWEGFIRDSATVVVEDAPSAGYQLRESFAQLDTVERWHLHGEPKPVPVRDGNGWALSLEGDAQYTDGLVGKRVYSLRKGITVELEFRLEINDPEKQRIDICLTDSDLSPSHTESGSATARSEAICFVYPDDGRQHYDSATASFGTSRSIRSVSVPAHLPPSEWTHLAIQVRPDGQASLFLNHEFVITHPAYATIRPDSRWRLEFASYAVGTPVMIRNLTVWESQRYDVPLAPGGEDDSGPRLSGKSLSDSAFYAVKTPALHPRWARLFAVQPAPRRIDAHTEVEASAGRIVRTGGLQPRPDGPTQRPVRDPAGLLRVEHPGAPRILSA